jgi:hypothetical protein
VTPVVTANAEPAVGNDLADVLAAKVREWVARVAPTVHRDDLAASLKIILHTPQGDDDGTLYLEARLEEELVGAEVGGRVPGVEW